MRIISPPVHGVLDYTVGALLVAVPWVLGFADHTAATYVPVACGIGAWIYSLLTDYEAGVYKLIPFKAHLGVDAVSGALLAASPWLFQFAERLVWPHVAAGVLELLVVGMTQVHTHEMRRGALPVPPSSSRAGG